ncbi:MAG TPA: hypothetical protein VN784_08890 [Candidatus Limnocylindrales bacterium]|nr:hypothetical protein [Candidatus Limnocylindrales bacterium]
MQTKKHSPTRAKKEFAEWASLFAGTLFMKVVAYIDESGRHDRTGKREGSGQIVIAGWVDWKDNWVKFCGQWQSILTKYDADFFHFYEWVEASKVAGGRKPPSSFSENPYKGWKLEKLDGFLYELAELAGAGDKIFVGSFISTRDFAEAKKHPAYSRFATAQDPYRACLNGLFESFAVEVQQQWPYWNEPVAFFFDHNDDPEWNHAVHDAFHASKKNESRMAGAELSFVDGKIPPHLPLQAADMIAYRMRQIAGKFTDPKIFPNPTKLDDLLIKPSFLRATPASLQGARMGYPSLLSLRYGNYPWRK